MYFDVMGRKRGRVEEVPSTRRNTLPAVPPSQPPSPPPSSSTVVGAIPPIATQRVHTTPIKERQTVVKKEPSPVKRERAAPKHIPQLGIGPAQIVTEIGKGWFTTRYLHLNLHHWGMAPLFDADDTTSVKVLRNATVGQCCCYLRMGTTVVVTGTIVGAERSKTSKGVHFMVEVSPEKGIGGFPEWIPLGDVFKVSTDMPSLRRVVHDEVLEMLRTEEAQEATDTNTDAQVVDVDEVM